MTRTPTLPITDRSMWQRLLSRAHPDAGGDHELFIWTGAVRDLVCSLRDRGGLSEPDDLHTSRHACPTHEEPARVPWDSGDDFEECTRTALRMGAVGDYYGQVLSLLADCYPLDHLAYEQ